MTKRKSKSPPPIKPLNWWEKYSDIIKVIESLDENTFESFLKEIIQDVIVYESPDYEYSQYFCIARPTKKVQGNGRFARQWG